jgi:hypothetical protein
MNCNINDIETCVCCNIKLINEYELQKKMCLKCENKTNEIAVELNKYCYCLKPAYNYPEMVWCDKCGKEIKEE